ncbi:AraC family transcriptional regulator [Agrobacterium rubi]|uniref:AraC family transcriptional regulator n=1 Tax=Agrobacterium rubi TaxID=28099 RepID=UPI001573B2B7|nr:AraC family transcriptional regulator [Agrobacterium rubi]NTF10763.1 AraC family transcriptional regulator [Agrobacterium rubi]NTF23178.1 AraC family transcriptional regulator [Agrobacterium rubi]NTF30098.1 AraC family transcriptional regulator [Agrobacterium rubi]
MRLNSVRGIEGKEDLAPSKAGGLERSCEVGFADGMRVAAPSHGVERMEARFHGNAFSPHRHDTYALGLTLHGVQTFRYRGTERFSSPGNVIVLHPDELHDGAAGTEDGLIYRMIYLPPDLIGAVDGYRHALPFVANPVVADIGIWQALADILADLSEEPSDLIMDDVVMRLASGLSRQAGAPPKSIAAPARSAVLRARDFIEGHCSDVVRSEALEVASGLDRYELARQFRRLLGTSPHRYLIMRKLELAKRSIINGNGLAQSAADAGFADQAHFTRHFRKAFGMTPGHWLAMRSASSG